MSISQLVINAAQAGIFLSVNDGELEFEMTVDEMPDAIREQLIANKPAIIDFLSKKTGTIARKSIIKRPATDDLAPATFAQQRLWFIDKMQGNSQEYHIPMVLKVSGKFDLEIAEQAIRNVIARHEVLRTVMVECDGLPMQQVLKVEEIGFSLPKHQFSGQQEDLDQRIIKEINRPYALERDLMVRGCYFELLPDSVGTQGVLVLTLHHIAADGWSLAIMTREFSACYEALRNGITPQLLAMEIQYSDYAYWQRNAYDEVKQQAELDYWQQQLIDVPAVHSLPLDYPRPQLKLYEGAVVNGTLTPVQATGLSTLAKSHQMTPFMVVHALLSLVLARHSGSNDILIGTPVANRTQSELEPLIGCFVNTLVLRANTAQADLVSYLAHIKQVHLDAQAYQELPFEQIVEHCQVVRSTAHSPLFQFMLSMNNTGDEALALTGVHMTPLQSEQVKAQFDLELSLALQSKNQSGGELNWIYDTALFSEQHITQINSHFVHLLEQLITAAKEQPLNEFELLNEAEKHHLIYTLNDTMQPDLMTHSWPELFDHQVSKTPNAIAVIDSAQQLTYQQLQLRANQVAYGLLAKGIKTDQLVALFDERGIDLLVMIMGVLKAGAAYLPLDPTQPSARWQQIIQEATPAIILSNVKDLKQHQQFTACCAPYAVWRLDEVIVETTTQPLVYPKLTDLAYVIFTSGSTGRPKGVMIEHQGMINNMLSKFSPLQLDENDVIAQTASQCFDISVWQFLTAAVLGAQVVIIDKTTVMDAQRLAASFNQFGVTIWEPVPAMMAAMVESSAALNTIKLVLPTGEALSSTLVNSWFSIYPNIPLLNAYGPAECSDDVCFELIERPVDTVYIGSPVANAQVHVVDQNQNLLPLGGIGELAVSGAVVGRGYHRRPDLTAEVFKTNPYPRFPGDNRLYLTGDIVRRHFDGRLQFIERKDFQVKIRGFRIELGEIEQHLRDYERVNEAVVIAFDDSHSEKRLVAYAQIPGLDDKDIQMVQEQCQAHLIQQLPQYMVPSVIIVMAKLPLSSNGKVDRKSLPNPSDQLSLQGITLPKNVQQQVLRKIWSKLLNCPEDSIGIDHDFFKLGGHSLLIIRLIRAIVDSLSVEIQIKDLFEASTIRELSVRIDERKGSTLLNITKRTDASISAPLSFSQYRLWFVEQLAKTNAHNMVAALEIKGQLDLMVLEQAMLALQQRHILLTSYIEEVDGEPRQMIAPDCRAKIQYHDLTEMDTESKQQQLKILTVTHDTQMFNLSSAPLHSLLVVKLAESEYRLHFNQHHIISDGWSQEIFYRQLFATYRSLAKGESLSSESAALDYYDFSYWQRLWLASDAAKLQREFWRAYLEDCNTELNLPFAGSDKKDSVSNMVLEQLPKAVMTGVEKLAKSHSTSVFNILHIGLAIAFSRISGQSDFNLGVAVSGRHQYATQDMLGMFVNNLPVRHQIETSSSFKDVICAEVANLKQVMSHQDLPFEQILEQVAIVRDQQKSPLFQVFINMLNLESAQDEDATLSELTITPIEAAQTEHKFALTLYLKQTAEGLDVVAVFDTALYARTSIQQFLAQYIDLMTKMIAQPFTAINQHSLLSCVEPRSIEANPQPLSVVSKLIRQVQHTPGVVAVRQGKSQWSYQELWRDINHVNAILKTYGIEKGERVAIYGSRDYSLIVSIYAVLQAGAVYTIVSDDIPLQACLQRIDIANAKVVLLAQQTQNLTQVLSVLGAHGVRTCLINLTTVDDYLIGTTVDMQAHEPACLTFTSGSTGTPKAVLGSQRGLSAYLDWFTETYQLTKGKSVSLLSGLLHDPLQRDIFEALSSGAELCIPSATVIAELKPGQWLAGNDINLCHITPSMAEVIVNNNIAIFSLEYVFITGEVLRKDVVVALQKLCPNAVLINCYGATESQRALTYFPITSETSDYQVIPVSRDSEDTQLILLNKLGNPCAIGEYGQIAIYSENIALGYFNDLADRSTGFLKPGVYKTGDFGFYLDESCIQIVGREDEQINVRGYRVELGHIEYHLRQQPDVAQAVVAQQNGNLIGYVVPANETVQTECLLAQLTSALPFYMVPSALVFLQYLPLNASGKLDRKGLPVFQGNKHLGEIQRPTSAIAKALAEIWCDLLALNNKEISLHDNFFELGGHSLLVVRMLSDIRRGFGQELTVKMVFDNPTIEQLSKLIPGINLANKKVIEKRPDFEVNPPLSFAQQRLWFVDKVQGSSREYHIPIVLKVSSPFDIAIAEQAINTIISRHEVLRTLLIEHDGVPLQKVLPMAEVQFSLPKFQLSEHDSDIDLHVAEQINRPFALDKDLMVRGCYFELLSEATPNQGLFVLTLHHIAADGWSLGLIVHEFSVCYEALSNKSLPELPAISIQYGDYAYWQRSAYNDAKQQAELAYWKQQLAGIPALHSLPLDYARPSMKQYEGATVTGALSQSQTAGVAAMASRHQMTPFMLVHALLSLVLARHSGSHDIVIGTPVANRLQSELAPLIGSFVNTLVLRANTEHASMDSYLAHIRQIHLDAQGNQELPFEQVVEHCQVGRSTAHSPLFQILLSTNNTEQANTQLTRVAMTPVEQKTVAAQYDLTLQADWGASGLKLRWIYDKAIFSAEKLTIFNQHFQRLVAACLVTNPTQISQLSMLSSDEIYHLTCQLNQTEKQFDTELGIHQLIAQQALKTPEAIAVCCDQQELSYHGLDKAAEQLANQLIDSYQIQASSVIAIALPRSINMLIAVLAVLKAECTYLPIDPSYPAERITLMLEDANPALLICDASFQQCSTSETCLSIDDLHLQQLIHSSGLPNQRVKSPSRAESLAYMIYTSGSTGRPKAVMVEHRQLTNFILAMSEQLPLSTSDSLLAMTSLAFDIHTLELFLPLISGAKLVIATKDETVSPERIKDLIVEHQVNIMQATPATWRMMLDSNWQLSHAFRALTGGEALPEMMKNQLLSLSSKLELWNMYGPTETCVWSAMAKMTAEKSVHIGRPIANTQFLVLDEDKLLVPFGAIGELYISGSGVTRGYFERNDLTSQQFVTLFGEQYRTLSGQRFYRTGDYVCYLPDGNLRCLGRRDEQVKIRGFRIELGDIESHLALLPEVNQAVVIADKRHQENVTLTAYVTLDKAELITDDWTSVVVEYLAKKLPVFMIPNHFVALDALPLTPNGKVDKKQLMQIKPEFDQQAIKEPASASEHKLAALIAELLDIPTASISVTSNFFSLGGHSLLAIKLISEIKQSFNVELRLDELFSMNSIEQLAKKLDSTCLQQKLEQQQASIEVKNEGVL